MAIRMCVLCLTFLLSSLFFGVGMSSAYAETADDWIAYLDDADPEVRMSAVRALGKLAGTGEAKKAAPSVVQAFKKEKDARVRYKLVWALGKMGPAAAASVPDLVAALEDKDLVYRVAETLGEIGPAAKAAIASLILALAREEVVHAVARALGKIGADSMPALIEAATSKEARVRAGVAEAFGEMGHRRAASSVGGGDSRVDKAVPTLSALLKDVKSDVRYHAARGLGMFQTHASGAVPALAEALKDKEKDVRYQSSLALGKIGAAAVPALVAALEDANACPWALKAFGAIGANAKDAVDSVIKTLDNDNADVRYEAIWVLSQIGDAAQSAVPQLKKIAKEDASEVNRARAKQALTQIRPPEKKEEKKEEEKK